jgi:hypothetical protein
MKSAAEIKQWNYMDKFKIEKLSWDQVRSDIKKLNPNLFSAIDETSPGKNQQFIKVKYKFGDYITKDGCPNLPLDDGKLLPISDHSVPSDIRKELGYAKIPLFFVLKKSCDVFVNVNQRIIPLNFFKEGDILGLFETLDSLTGNASSPIWNVTAGSRSLFMLPKISEQQGINRLRKIYKLPATIDPNNFIEQWDIFKHIAQQEKFDEKWECEVLFFTEGWITDKNYQKTWSPFFRYLVKIAWHGVYTSGYFSPRVIWQSFVDTIMLRKLSPRPYISDTVKHLLGIIYEIHPAFSPADDSETIAPTKSLQNIFVDVYGLKNYYPSFMYASTLNVQTNPTVYYSLSFPILLEGTPIALKQSKIMNDLREIKHLLDTFWQRSEIVQKDSGLKSITFDYFHTEKDMYNEISSTELIYENDQRFIGDQTFINNKKFCLFSPFWRGCIRISKK